MTDSNDKTTVHIVVIFIGVIAALLAAGMLVLNYQGKGIDPTLNTLGGAALGSLVTLLTSISRGGKDAPAPVAVVNTDPAGRHAADPAASDTAPVGSDLPVTDLTL